MFKVLLKTTIKQGKKKKRSSLLSSIKVNDLRLDKCVFAFCGLKTRATFYLSCSFDRIDKKNWIKSCFFSVMMILKDA